MAVYITDHSTPVPKTHSWRIASNSATYLLPHLTPTSKILDIGCGPSSISIDFARRANQGYIIGIEHVPDPLNQARHLAASQDMTNIDFQLGDIHALEFLDNIFNIVHVHRVLQYITNPVKALDEIRRVIKKRWNCCSKRICVYNLVSRESRDRQLAQTFSINRKGKRW